MVFRMVSVVGVVATACLAWSAAGVARELPGASVEYQVDIKKAPPATQVDAAWQIDTIPTCKQWTISQTIKLNLRSGNAYVPMVMTQRGEESVDGLSGRYTLQASAQGKTAQTTQSVVYPAKGQPGKITLKTAQQTTTKEIPPGVLLVIPASQYIVDQLEAGKTDFTIKAVELSSPDGVAESHFEVLSQSPFSPRRLPADSAGLLKGKFWLVRATIQSSRGSEEIMMQVHESGVTSRILVTVSGIAMELTARSVIVHRKPNC